MRRTVLASLLLLTTIVPADAAEPRRPPPPRCAPLVAVPAQESDPPIAWIQNRHVVGAGVEALTLIGREIGVPVEWHADGPFDLLVGLRPDDERGSRLSPISPRLAFDPVSVMVRAGTAFPYQQWPDLKGRSGIAVTGEGYGPDLDRIVAEQLQVRRVDGNGALLTTLLAGRADYAIGGRFALTARAGRNGVADRIAFLEPALTGVDRVLAFDRQSPCLGHAARIGELLGRMTRDGTMDQLIRDAFSRWGREQAR